MSSDTPRDDSGGVWIWLGAGAVALALLVVFGVLTLIAVRGLGQFWPAPLTQFTFPQRTLIGTVMDTESITRARYVESRGPAAAQGLPHGTEAIRRELLRTGNRDLAAPDFRWIDSHEVLHRTTPLDLVALERSAWGPAYGYVEHVYEHARVVASGADAFPALAPRLARNAELTAQITALQNGPLPELAHRIELLRRNARDPARAVATTGQEQNLPRLLDEVRALEARIGALRQQLARDSVGFRISDGTLHRFAVSSIVRAWQPNAMTTSEKLGFFLSTSAAFLGDSPREANTEGGVFPAIFGTVMLVMLMALLVTPFGVIAAVYLHEYARPGWGVRTLRIAINNLAGVPSIVYGVFGLGFFVYVVGGSVDELFFSDKLPSPTFGSPGLLWAAWTLALLTVPVVIVSTEEGLARIPREMRDGAMALGATRAETLRRIVLPAAIPAILTGVILAIARAAGEVAPLMLVGVVKLAPQLPLDGTFPYLHLDRQFMHLGFHIYDVGFQSPNVDASRPLVYATALLLVAIIIALNLLAILLRSRLYHRYRPLEV